jgi:hypothetical protein
MLWALASFAFLLATPGGVNTRLLAISPSAEAADLAYQGFGATTPGGSEGTIVRVTNLNDSGPGSFRDAVSQGNRTVVFDVAGELVLTSTVYVKGPFITIDGFTAPPPGITLRNYGLGINGTRGAHDVIVRGIRVRGAGTSADKEQTDGIHIVKGAYNVVIDHVSIHGSEDGNLDIGTGARNVTVSWSIFAEPRGTQKNMLIKYNPSRVTLHHNIFVRARQRNPQVRIDDAGTPAADTTLDMRNNLVWDWGGGYGTLIWYGSRANVVNNFYSSPNSSVESQRRALVVGTRDGSGGELARVARAYVRGNFSADNLPKDINIAGNEPGPFPAPSVDTQDACTAARSVLSGAGVRPLDSIDRRYLSAILLPSCVDTPDEARAPDLLPRPSSPGRGPDGDPPLGNGDSERR